MWCVIENLLLLGGSSVGELRSLINSAKALARADKYKISNQEFSGKDEILNLLKKIDKANPEGADHFVLRPLRNVIVDPKETEEDFQLRMLESHKAEFETSDGAQWIKLYTGYVQARQEGRLDDLQFLEVL